jgi:hypothetical protein
MATFTDPQLEDMAAYPPLRVKLALPLAIQNVGGRAYGPGMPSPWHDSVTGLIADDPVLAVQIVRDLMGEPLPPGLTARLAPPGFNDRPSKDFACDTVVVAGPHHDPVRGIIVEAQQEQSNAKRHKMAKYAAELWVLLGCPVDVVVICPDKASAGFYAQPVRTGLPGYTFTARPLFPAAVPVITDPAQMAARPGLAALVLAFHGLVPGVLPAFLSGMEALGDRGPAYYEVGYCPSPAQVKRLLEEAVATGTWPVYSPFAKKHFGEGLAQGKAEGEIDGEREAILLFLSARHLEVSDQQRTRVQACTDQAQLRHWIEQAATITSTAELFT